MPLLAHAIIVASYFVLASAIALLAPAYIPGVSEAMSPFAWIVTFLMCGFAQCAFFQSDRERRMNEELILMRRRTREIADDLLNTQTQALQMRESLEQVGKAGEQRVLQKVSEVKVLQGLSAKNFRFVKVDAQFFRLD